MSIACIIEHESIPAKQIETTLREIDPQLKVFIFNDLGGFYQWFSSAIKPTPNQIKKEDLKLLIGDLKFLGPRYFSLIEKVRKLMMRRGLLAKEDDLAIILTGYDSPLLDAKQIESRIITNMIFKPFDLPILKQLLQISLSNKKTQSSSTVFTQSISATAEMLKDVQLESFNELGFTTRSNRMLNINDVSKYYGTHFNVVGKPGILARCLSCKPHKIHNEEFEAEFQFVGLNNNQIKKLRSDLFSVQNGKDESLKQKSLQFIKTDKKKGLPQTDINLISFISSSTDPCIEIKSVLEQNLNQITLSFNRHLDQFLNLLEKKDYSSLGDKPIHGFMINDESISSQKSTGPWEKIIEHIAEYNQAKFNFTYSPKLFLISQKEIPDDKIRTWAQIIEDIIRLPIDRPYLLKRFLTIYPGLLPKHEYVEILFNKTNEVIRVANPIEISSISEAGMTMKYYRSISFHSFRRFCLPSFNGSEILELPASCFYFEKKGNDFINHFVFFGITDKYHQYIRKWILEGYIATKTSA